MKNSLVKLALAGLFSHCLATASASAQGVYWSTWNAPAGFPTGGTASGNGYDYWNGISGSIGLPRGGSVSSSLSGEVIDTSCFATNAGSCSGNASYWSANSWSTLPTGTFTSQYVTSAPSTGQIVAQAGYTNPAHTLTFAQPLTNLIMSVWSLGSPNNQSAYVFTEDFIILSQDPRCNPTTGNYCLVKDGRTLKGKEGAGTIQFLGRYSSISWTVTVPEFYSGFTFGITNAPNAYNTQEALRSQLPQLVSVLNHELAVLNNGLNYDCHRFGQNNWCISGGARYSASSGADVSSGGGFIVVAYRPHTNFRVGAFLDYAAYGDSPTRFDRDNASPMVGAFLGYGQEDGVGLQARASIAYKSSDLSQTRDASLLFTEPGRGDARVRAWAAQLEVAYGIRVSDSLLMSPFVAFRSGAAARGRYAEEASSEVTAPLSFDRFGISQRDIVVGLRGVYAVNERLSLGGALSVEKTLSSDEDALRGVSSIYDLSSFALSAPKSSSRARLSGGLSATYLLEQGKWLSLGVTARDLPYNNEKDVTVRLTFRTAL